MPQNCPNCNYLLDYLICIREQTWKEYPNSASLPVGDPPFFYKLTWRCPNDNYVLVTGTDPTLGRQFLEDC